MLIILSLLIWFACGVYGALSNMERIPRVFPTIGASGSDSFQHMLTVFLGPIGLVLVLTSGGRMRFWSVE